MSGIKNKDGSVNWNEVKINPVIDRPWGVKVNTAPVELNLTEAYQMLVQRIVEIQDWADDATLSHDYREGIRDTCYELLTYI